jgi:DMSO/TMAO reductase YedYZ molybdopterin-dependent catalytic subunit
MRAARPLLLAASVSLVLGAFAGGRAFALRGGDEGARPLLRVGGDVPRSLELGASDLAQFPRHTLRVKDRDGKEHTYEGAALSDILSKAEVVKGEDLRGERLLSYLLVEAADGYRVVFALPEIDPAFTDQEVLLADRRDGEALRDPEGPLRLIVPREKKHARWVRQVVRLRVLRVPPPAEAAAANAP